MMCNPKIFYTSILVQHLVRQIYESSRVPPYSFVQPPRVYHCNGVDTYSWIGHRLQTGLTLAFLLLSYNFKSETSFGFLSPNYTGHVFWFYFEKSKNELVWQFLMFLEFVAKIPWFSDNSNRLANSRITSVKLTCACEL